MQATLALSWELSPLGRRPSLVIGTPTALPTGASTLHVKLYAGGGTLPVYSEVKTPAQFPLTIYPWGTAYDAEPYLAPPALLPGTLPFSGQPVYVQQAPAATPTPTDFLYLLTVEPLTAASRPTHYTYTLTLPVAVGERLWVERENVWVPDATASTGGTVAFTATATYQVHTRWAVRGADGDVRRWGRFAPTAQASAASSAVFAQDGLSAWWLSAPALHRDIARLSERLLLDDETEEQPGLLDRLTLACCLLEGLAQPSPHPPTDLGPLLGRLRGLLTERTQRGKW